MYVCRANSQYMVSDGNNNVKLYIYSIYRNVGILEFMEVKRIPLFFHLIVAYSKLNITKEFAFEWDDNWAILLMHSVMHTKGAIIIIRVVIIEL